MARTYVFDFYNLYIPKNRTYENTNLGIRIKPLKFAEEFEKNRNNFSSSYYKGGWKTAKCFIKAENDDDANKIAGWLEFLYSFAQGRSVFFLGWYEYNKGRKYSSFHSKFVEPRENRQSELIHGTLTRGPFYSRDIGSFIDISLKTINESDDGKLNDLLTTIHSYNISRSNMVIELKFLICWMTLEKLSNTYYNEKYNPEKKLFNQKEIEKIKDGLEKYLKSNIKDIRKFNILKGNIVDRNFLYEHDTRSKMKIYLNYLDLGFERKKLNKKIETLVGIRVNLVHNLDSRKLMKSPQNLFYLQKITENVIFRLLGIDREMQNRFLLNQYNLGDDL